MTMRSADRDARIRVILHVERLVLEGFPAGTDPARVRAALERDLASLLQASPPSRWRGGAVNAVTAAGQGLPVAHRPEAIGHGIAAAAHAGIIALQSGRSPL